MVAHIMYPFNVVANVMAVNNSGSVYARPDLYMNYATCWKFLLALFFQGTHAGLEFNACPD